MIEEGRRAVKPRLFVPEGLDGVHARGAQGGEIVTFQFGLLGKDKTYSDTGSGKLEKVALTKEWKKYTIDLTGKDLARIKTGFSWVVAGQGHPLTFYLDDIRYQRRRQSFTSIFPLAVDDALVAEHHRREGVAGGMTGKVELDVDDRAVGALLDREVSRADIFLVQQVKDAAE